MGVEVATWRAGGMDMVTVMASGDAACRGRDPKLWDVDHAAHTSLFRRCGKCVAAVRICDSCPLRQRCRAEGIRDGDTSTIRGGWTMVPGPRRTQRQVVPASACAQCGLPVLRRNGSRFCSTRCARIQARHHPSHSDLAA